MICSVEFNSFHFRFRPTKIFPKKPKLGGRYPEIHGGDLNTERNSKKDKMIRNALIEGKWRLFTRQRFPSFFFS